MKPNVSLPFLVSRLRMTACETIAAIALNLLIALLFYPATRARMEAEIVAKARERSTLMETVRAATTIKVMGREPEREAIWRNVRHDSNV